MISEQREFEFRLLPSESSTLPSDESLLSPSSGLRNTGQNDVTCASMESVGLYVHKTTARDSEGCSNKPFNWERVQSREDNRQSPRKREP
jgi:hypothetical protein